MVNSSDGLTLKERSSILATLDPASDTFGNMTASVKKYYKTTTNGSAQQIAHRNLKKVSKVKLTSDLTEPLTADWVISRLKLLAETAKGEQNRIRALELLGKYKELQLFKEVTQVENVTITTKEESDLDAEFKSLVASRIESKATPESL